MKSEMVGIKFVDEIKMDLNHIFQEIKNQKYFSFTKFQIKINSI